MSIENGKLVFWVVYRHPLDFPGKWVLRGQSVGSEGVVAHKEAFVADTLEEVRSRVPCGDTRLNRDANDDPAIYEVWL